MAYREIEDKKPIRMRAHSVLMENRERVIISGVQDVDSFNEVEVILVTEAGYMTVAGDDLHIAKLNLEEGQLVIEGMIIAVEYDAGQHEEKSSMFGRFFR